MKENINIDELFKQKFDNFQPEVDPSVWANVQASIGPGTTVATGVKIGLISTGIIAASVATWYFGFYEPQQPESVTTQNTEMVVDQPTEEINIDPIIVVSDQNDPAIIENRQQIEQELLNHQAEQQPAEIINPVEGGNSNPTQNNIIANNPNVVVNNNQNQQNVEPDVVVSDDKKVKIPTGRMEIIQNGLYAPSQTTFSSNAINYSKVRWDFGDGSGSEGTDAKHTYAVAGKYTVKMTVYGETTNYQETQEVIVKSRSSIDNIPNVITVNGDRINDYFSVRTTDIETFMITIMDRNGNEVFTSNDKDFMWDGTNFSGETVEKGIYTYIIIAEGKDGSVIKIPGQIYVQ